MSISFVHVMVYEGLIDRLLEADKKIGFVSIPSFVPFQKESQQNALFINVDSYLSTGRLKSESPTLLARNIYQRITEHEMLQLYWQFRRRNPEPIQLGELYSYLLPVIGFCLDLLESTGTSSLVYGGIPHSFYDYALLLTARYMSMPLTIFQEFPWTPYGCIQYSEYLVPLMQERHFLNSKLPALNQRYLDVAESLARNVVRSGKAFIPDFLHPDTALTRDGNYWLRSYLENLPPGKPLKTGSLSMNAGFLCSGSDSSIACLKQMAFNLDDTPLASVRAVSLYRHLLHLEQFQISPADHSGSDCSIFILPLPCEPECSLNPMCSEFVTTEEIVKFCIDAIPDDSLLLLKEHPGMLGVEGSKENPYLDPIETYRFPLHELVMKHANLGWLPVAPSLEEAEFLRSIPILYAVGTIGVEAYLKALNIIPIATSLLNLVGFTASSSIDRIIPESIPAEGLDYEDIRSRSFALYTHILPFSPVGKFNGFFPYSSESDYISGRRLANKIIEDLSL